MNCREAQSHIYAEGDGALENNQRVTLEAHVGHCPDCRRIRDDLSAALSAWRTEAATTPVPDSEREWHAIRRRIRGGAEADTAGSARPARASRPFFPWLMVPVCAAAALALAVYVAGPKPGRTPSTALPDNAPRIARADLVEVPGGASTIVFVDNKSGWLFVQASDSRG